MITYDFVCSLHSGLEDLGMCRKGVRDINLLLSIINGQQWFNTEFECYCHVAYCINAYHVFVDGNKRTAFLVLKELNKKGVLFKDRALCQVILDLAINSNSTSKELFMTKVNACIVS